MTHGAVSILFLHRANLYNGETCRSEKFGFGVTDCVCWRCQTCSEKSSYIIVKMSVESPGDSKFFHQDSVFLGSRDMVNTQTVGLHSVCPVYTVVASQMCLALSLLSSHTWFSSPSLGRRAP